LIGRVPEIQQAFPKGPIDLNDTTTRQTVWRLMYGVYKRAGAHPLESLMTLVGKYLKAYTHHTTYNIRDFGKNYLDTNFPVNLAGQIERDCGVYALTVAWDVFATVKHADPGVEVTFSLRVMLDHIILVMEDKSTAQSYVVSNDRITRLDPIQLPPPRRSLAEVTYDESAGAVCIVDAASAGRRRNADRHFPRNEGWKEGGADVDGLRAALPVSLWQALSV